MSFVLKMALTDKKTRRDISDFSAAIARFDKLLDDASHMVEVLKVCGGDDPVALSKARANVIGEYWYIVGNLNYQRGVVDDIRYRAVINARLFAEDYILRIERFDTMETEFRRFMAEQGLDNPDFLTQCHNAYVRIRHQREVALYILSFSTAFIGTLIGQALAMFALAQLKSPDSDSE